MKFYDLLKNFQVDTVIPAMFAPQVDLLKSVRDYYQTYEQGLKSFGIMTVGPPKYQRIAWISHRKKLNRNLFGTSLKFYTFTL